MTLGEKIRYLRQMEGTLRGLNRAMTQQEVVRALRKEMHQTISQSYLSQIESGSRSHMTSTTRQMLASFFKVHPGYLVSDPEGFHTELLSDVRSVEETLDSSLINVAESVRNDPELQAALLAVARHDDTRKCLILLAAILDTPGLADRLLHVLKGQTA
jgi:transcriptional regulator with XRE-family HTH domain